MNKQQKKIAGELAVLGLVLAFAVPHILNGGSGSTAKNMKATGTKTESTSAVKQNSANASTKAGTGSDKLKIDNLVKNTYTLQSTTAQTNPFASLTSDEQKHKQEQEAKAQQAKQQKADSKTLPSTVNVGDHIDNNFTAPPADFTAPPADFAAPQAASTDGLKLKAIAQTGDKIIAVIESDGKRYSSFVGSTVGSFTVTDIDSSHAYLQDDNGFTSVLDLSK